jgi:hypothetical protein
VQVLYVVEVFMSASVDATAPHTSRWICHLLHQLLPHCLTLREYLYLHRRLFQTDVAPTPS